MPGEESSEEVADIDTTQIPERVQTSSKVEVYWQAKFEGIKEGQEVGKQHHIDQPELSANVFKEMIQNIVRNPMDAIPNTSWGDVNSGEQSDDRMGGLGPLAPIISFTSAGAGIGGLASGELPLYWNTALIAISLGTALSWYLYIFKIESDSSDSGTPSGLENALNRRRP